MEYLKIKDNVELTELEKFGFYANSKAVDGHYRWAYYDKSMTNSEIEIEVYDNKIDITGLCYEEFDYAPIVDLQPLSNKLFDLIQAGLVEKVVE